MRSRKAVLVGCGVPDAPRSFASLAPARDDVGIVPYTIKFQRVGNNSTNRQFQPVDCRVASLLAMTRREIVRNASHFPRTSSSRVIANQCAHWCGNPAVEMSWLCHRLRCAEAYVSLPYGAQAINSRASKSSPRRMTKTPAENSFSAGVLL